ncbi:MAG TPA: hypothetical protein VHV51_04515 [Polyangiaceae bacterium]|jgi:hypothetical protein|nr:hypothetical protein [Polyangiaceae bacterium]
MFEDLGLVFGETVTITDECADFLVGLPWAEVRIVEQAGVKR